MMPFVEGIRSIAKAGFDGLEVMITGDKITQDGSQLKSMAADHGMTVGSVHAPFLLLTRGVFTTDPIEKIKRSITVAEAAGAHSVVVHPPYRWQTAYSNWLENELDDFASGTSIEVSMENMFPVWVRGRALTFHKVITTDDLAAFQHVTLDTSHLAVAGIDILDAFKKVQDRLGHIHLSNNHGHGRDSHAPLESGVLPMVAFMNLLRDNKFSGSVTLEMDVRDRADKPADLVALLADQVAMMRDNL